MKKDRKSQRKKDKDLEMIIILLLLLLLQQIIIIIQNGKRQAMMEYMVSGSRNSLTFMTD